MKPSPGVQGEEDEVIYEEGAGVEGGIYGEGGGSLRCRKPESAIRTRAMGGTE